MTEQKTAVIIIETEKDADGEYIPCIVKENAKGYFLTDWRWGKDKATAEKLADDYNAGLGLDKNIKEIREIRHDTQR